MIIGETVMNLCHCSLEQLCSIFTSTAPVGNESVPIQLAQCWFRGLAVYNAEIQIHLSNKTDGNNSIKQHSETVTVWNHGNADCSLKKQICCIIYYIFPHTFVSWHVRIDWCLLRQRRVTDVGRQREGIILSSYQHQRQQKLTRSHLACSSIISLC